MGAAKSSPASRISITQPVLVNLSEVEGVKEFSLSQLSVELPNVPGDIALCGKLDKATSEALAPRFKSWVNLNGVADFFPEALRGAGTQHVEVRAFPGPPTMPDEEQATAALAALDKLPRPLMIQCSSGNRAGCLLLLWLAKKHSYSPESAKQLADDSDFKFWQRCTPCGPMREWLMEQLPAAHSATVLRPASNLILCQLFEPASSTYTYLLGCSVTHEALLIDPVIQKQDRDLALVHELGLTLRYVVNTHCHADHITAGGSIRKELQHVRTVISKASGARADILVEPHEKIKFGTFSLEAIPTPGHTDGCVSWLLPGSPNFVFTGDALLIRGCGRTDFQQGDAAKLYESVHTKLFTLPGDTVVYPGHDYKDRNASTIDEEKRFNPRLSKSKEEFLQLMNDLNLPYPKQIDIAVPWNMVCGVQDDVDIYV